MSQGNINPRVVAWAKTVRIDPEQVRRLTPDGEQFRISDTPWTVLFVAWIDARWNDWRNLCPTPQAPLWCEHCNNQEAFTAWLFRYVNEEVSLPVGKPIRRNHS